MEINYTVIALFALGVLCLIILIIRKNLKDKKTFEQEMYKSEIKPDKHDDDDARI